MGAPAQRMRAGRPAICDVAHVAFRVTNLAKARAFYGTYLGFAEPFAVFGQGRGIKINDSQYIELHEEPVPAGNINYPTQTGSHYTLPMPRRYARTSRRKACRSLRQGEQEPARERGFTFNECRTRRLESIGCVRRLTCPGMTQGQAMPDSHRHGNSSHRRDYRRQAAGR